MSYSDDTAEFMFSGRPTMDELALVGRRLCDSCRINPNDSQITFGDGQTFFVCSECRPFDPKGIKVISTDPDPDEPTGPSY